LEKVAKLGVLKDVVEDLVVITGDNSGSVSGIESFSYGVRNDCTQVTTIQLQKGFKIERKRLEKQVET